MTPCPLWRWGEPVRPLLETLSRRGALVIPTESSYGLAVEVDDATAVANLFRMKGRPADKPLPVVAADLDQLRGLGVRLEGPAAENLIELWPAPLTILAPLTRPLAAAVGSDRLAVRIPAHAGLRKLLRELGRPLTATSANRSGAPPILAAADAAAWLADEDAVVIDDGVLPGGAPSTIVVLEGDGWRVVREGRLGVERLPGMGGTLPDGAPVATE